MTEHKDYFLKKCSRLATFDCSCCNQQYNININILEKELKIARKKSSNTERCKKILTLASAYSSIKQTKKATNLYKEVISLGKQIVPEDCVLVEEAMYRLAYLYLHTGQNNNAIIAYKEVIDYSKTRFFFSNPNNCNNIGNLGTAYFRVGEYKLALETLEKALRFQKCNKTYNIKEMILNLETIIPLYKKFNKKFSLVRAYEELINLLDQKEKQKIANYTLDLAYAYNDIKQYKKALRIQMLQLKNILSTGFGDEKEEKMHKIGNLFADIASTNHLLKQYSEAYSMYKKATNYLTRCAKPDIHTIWITMFMSAKMLFFDKKYDEAVEKSEKAYNFIKTSYTNISVDHQWTCMELLINAYSFTKQYEKMLQVSKELAKFAVISIDHTDHRLGNVFVYIASAYKMIGNFDNAITFGEMVLKFLQRGLF